MTSPKKLLIVDDDRQVLRYLCEVLDDAGYDTTACERYIDAKGVLNTTTPDLLLTDVRLGAYNGLQLAIFAKDRHPEMPVIVLTGYEDPTLRAAAANSGALYLVKPVLRETLLIAVAKALDPQ